MAQLLSIFGFLAVLLRSATLSFQSLAIGGIVFGLWILRNPADASGQYPKTLLDPTKRLIRWSAVALAIAQVLYVASNSVILMATAELQFGDVIGANFFLAGSATVVAALTLAVGCGSKASRITPILLLPAGIILASSVATSHAVARVDGRALLAAATGLHQAATATWIGGLPYLLVALRRAPDAMSGVVIGQRFSRLALTSVVALALAAAIMTIGYVDSPKAIYGTAYGLMVGAKGALFGLLMILGLMNSLIVRRARGDSADLLRLRSFVEAEIGIGFTVILAAASLTSQPPAIDMTFTRVRAAEIAERMSPRWPRLESPDIAELSEPALQTQKRIADSDTPPLESYVPGGAAAHPNTQADIAWSEYNHHWAGLVVLAMGLLALLARTGWANWARSWPLAFLGLALFLFLRADPESWPLGPNGFWESFADFEVLQHRAFVVLIVAFAVFEWRVQTGRASGRSALVFPLVCAIGGALLLTHSHALGNIKEELLAELSHVPLALLGVMAGWSRWLELRLTPQLARVPAWIWPISFVLVGLVLLDYRES